MLRSRIKTFSCHRGLGKVRLCPEGSGSGQLLFILSPRILWTPSGLNYGFINIRIFFSFIAPLFMCNSIVPTLYRNINPKIIFRKKTVVFIFSLASVDMCILCPDCCSVFMRSSPNQSWVWIILQSSENNEGREASLIVPMVTEYT